MEFKILTSELLDKYREALMESPQEKLDKINNLICQLTISSLINPYHQFTHHESKGKTSNLTVFSNINSWALSFVPKNYLLPPPLIVYVKKMQLF